VRKKLMPSTTPMNPVPKGMLWTGRVLSALVTLFMLFDGTIKVIKLPAAMEGTAKLGYPLTEVFPLGVVVLVCTLLYAIPRTAVLGAILLTAYFGGATATQVRVQDAWFIFPVVIGMLTWGGLFLRDDRVRALIPLRRN
jgi:hypothetical protein